MGSLAVTDVRVLLETSRSAVRTFFDGLDLELVPSDRPDLASVAIVDVSPDTPGAVELCRRLRAEQPALTLVALLCCEHAVTPWNLRALLASGVSGLLDLAASPADARQVLERAARGESVIHLRLGPGGSEMLRDVLSARPERRGLKLELLALVAAGLTDREIGLRLHLSPHTVKHQIDQLRRTLGTRNRTELAAWAGRHGFYAPEAAPRGAALPR
jgi:two-component system, NarL family, response regulator DevR